MTNLDAGGRTPGWLLDEMASAGRENLDAAHVARYDAKEDAAAGAEVARLEALGLGPESTVIDLGAGTGQFTLAVAPRCRRVVAVDVSPVMLRHLRAKVVAAGLANVETVRAGFLTYVHEGGAADVVYSRYALHHLPDFWKAVGLRRIHGVLRRGGILRLWDIVYDFGPADATERLETWCSTGGDDVNGGWSRSELEEHARDEHSTFTWLLEPMIGRCGLEILEATHSPDGFIASYVCRRRD